jgi:hypothetical protein
VHPRPGGSRLDLAPAALRVGVEEGGDPLLPRCEQPLVRGE